jgi:hypothetical protein
MNVDIVGNTTLLHNRLKLYEGKNKQKHANRKETVEIDRHEEYFDELMKQIS